MILLLSILIVWLLIGGISSYFWFLTVQFAYYKEFKEHFCDLEGEMNMYKKKFIMDTFLGLFTLIFTTIIYFKNPKFHYISCKLFMWKYDKEKVEVYFNNQEKLNTL